MKAQYSRLENAVQMPQCLECRTPYTPILHHSVTLQQRINPSHQSHSTNNAIAYMCTYTQQGLAH